MIWVIFLAPVVVSTPHHRESISPVPYKNECPKSGNTSPLIIHLPIPPNMNAPKYGNHDRIRGAFIDRQGGVIQKNMTMPTKSAYVHNWL